MARTFVDQPTQVFHSDDYNDQFTTGINLVSSSQSLEDDLNALRTQIKTVLYGTASYVSGNWYDEPTGVANVSFARGVTQLNAGLTTVEQQRFIYDIQSLGYVVVPSGSNFVSLSVSGSTAPFGLAAVGLGTIPGTFTGSIVSTLASGTQAGQTHSLSLISGTSAITPRNLVYVRDAYSHDAITDQEHSNVEVYGLLQIESSSVDGNAFSDTFPNRTQISFVVEYPSGSFVAASSSSIGGRHINYQYRARTTYSNLPEDAYVNTVFIDMTPIASGFAHLSDITLQEAINNQGNTVVNDSFATTINLGNSGSWSYTSGSTTLWSINSSSQVTNVTNITYNIGDLSNSGSFIISSGSTQLFSIYEVNGTSSLYINTNNFFISSSSPTAFTNGIIVGSGSNAIYIDTYPTTGVGPTNTSVISTQSGSNLILSGGSQLIFTDYYAHTSGSSGSLYPQGGIPLSSGTNEWNTFVTEFGPVSILGAFLEMSSSLSSSISHVRKRASAGTTPAQITANTNVTYPTNLDAQLLNYSGKSFIQDMNIYLNGILLLNGYTAGNPNDVYPGTSTSTGDLKFPMKLRSGSIISMEIF